MNFIQDPVKYGRKCPAGKCKNKAHAHWRPALSWCGPDGRRNQKAGPRFTRKSDAETALDQWRSALIADPTKVTLSYGEWRAGKAPRQAEQAGVLGAEMTFREWAAIWLADKVASHDHRGTTAEAASKYLLGKPTPTSQRDPGTCIAEAKVAGGEAFGDLRLVDITWQHVHDAIRAEAQAREDTIYRTMTLRGWSYLGACLRRAVSNFDLDARVCDRDRVKPPTKKQVDMATAKRKDRAGETDTREPWQRWDLKTARVVLQHVKEHHGRQWFAIVRLALGVGLRRSEICGLQWKNVDLDVGLIHVRGPRASMSETPNGLIEFNPPKSAAGTRTVPIGRDLMVALQEWAEEQAVLLGTTVAPADGFVFTGDNGSHWRPKTMSDVRWKAMARELAPHVAGVTFHGLRKISGAFGLSYFGEDLYAVARRLGHSDIKVTQGHYAYLNLDRAEAFAQARSNGLALAS